MKILSAMILAAQIVTVSDAHICMVMDNVGVVRGVSVEEAARTPGMIFQCGMTDDDALNDYFAAQKPMMNPDTK